MSKRIQKVASLLRSEISTIIRNRLQDQRVGFISITEVDVSPDLRLAKVYYCQLGSAEEKKRTKTVLSKACKFIKYEIGKVIQIKTIPDLVFIFDDTVEKGFAVAQKIDELLAEDQEKKS